MKQDQTVTMRPLLRFHALLVCVLIGAELVLSTSAMIIMIAALGLLAIRATRIMWRREIRIVVDVTLEEIAGYIRSRKTSE